MGVTILASIGVFTIGALVIFLAFVKAVVDGYDEA